MKENNKKNAMRVVFSGNWQMSCSACGENREEPGNVYEASL